MSRPPTQHEVSAHAHHQDDDSFNRSGERRTIFVVLLAFAMMIGELVVGYMSNSKALTADGWHMGTHVGALGLTLIAYWYARTRSGNDAFSFGTGKVYALAGFTSGIVLVIVALHLGIESTEALVEGSRANYGEALPIAVLGLIVNGASALLLGTGHTYGGHSHGHGHDHHGHDHHDHANGNRKPAGDGKPKAGTMDWNMRAAYIHILADALTSMLAIIALSLGYWADIWFLDPMVGIVGGLVIIWWAIGLCRQASRQLLDVVSSPAHEERVREQLEAIDDVRVADLHVWELGPGRRSCIVSLVTSTPRDVDYYRQAVLKALPVAHLTIEIHQCGHHQADAAAPHVAHTHEH
ncbi:MAG: CDF family Co(II)/Ni(II) efflux transporter DmeF [Myxococcota bacterium]|nr:CDF family Co(II)/Ni(II) efflux transporter DmeF [Myxococcota bacterium]